MLQNGKELKRLGFELVSKHKRSDADEQLALEYLTQATDSQDLDSVARADCLLKIGEIYRDRTTKSKEDYNSALEFYVKATEVKGLPGWYSAQNQVERIAMCPDVYGFNPEWRNEEIAQEMHKQILQRQHGGDLSITASDWFKTQLESSNIVNYNYRYTKVGLDYLDKALETCWDDLWKSVAQTYYGRAYKYHSAKTAESFNNAITWFQKSIDLKADAKSSNQPWTIIGKGSARAYFELAELLSNPTRFGFDQSLIDEERGNKIYDEGVAHISKYGPLGPYSIIESMYVDVWKKSLLYGRNKIDLPRIKELVQTGRSLGRDKDAALYLFEAVAEHATSNRSKESYQNIVESYHKSLNAKKELEGSDWIIEELVRWATPLVINPTSEDFSQETLDLECTQKLREDLREIEKTAPNKYFNQKVKDILEDNFKAETAKPTH